MPSNPKVAVPNREESFGIRVHLVVPSELMAKNPVFLEAR